MTRVNWAVESSGRAREGPRTHGQAGGPHGSHEHRDGAQTRWSYLCRESREKIGDPAGVAHHRDGKGGREASCKGTEKSSQRGRGRTRTEGVREVRFQEKGEAS